MLRGRAKGKSHPLLTGAAQMAALGFARHVMFWVFASMVFLGIIPAISCEARSSFATPTPGLLESISRQHHRSDWVRITTDSTQYEARIREIGALGLSGIAPRRGAAPAPDAIRWSSVARLDRVRSGSRVGQILGAAGLGSLGLPAVQSGEVEALGIVALGAVVGTWLGGRIGGHWVGEHALYEGLPVPDSAGLVPDPMSGLSEAFALPVAAPSGSAAPTVSSRTDLARIDRTVRRLRRSQRLRIRGPLGEFEGFMVKADVDGLHGLRPSDGEGGRPQSPRDIGWDLIGGIDRRGNSAGRGAIVGAVPVAVLGLVAGLALVAGGGIGGSGSGTNGEALAAGLGGAAIGASIGGLLGGLIGCAIPRWHQVY